jgi:hypothetical protein
MTCLEAMIANSLIASLPAILSRCGVRKKARLPKTDSSLPEQGHLAEATIRQ